MFAIYKYIYVYCCQYIHSWYRLRVEWWLFPMARNRQNKLSERAKKTWQQKANDPQQVEKKKNPTYFSFSQTCFIKQTDTIFKGARKKKICFVRVYTTSLLTDSC